MAAALKDLLKDLVPDEVLAELRTIGRALGIPESAMRPNTPIGSFFAVFARWICVPWNAQILPALRALYLDYATGVWLTLIAWLLYGVHRKGATFASDTLTVENRAGGFYTINPGDIRFQLPNGKTYRNTSTGTLTSYSGSGAYPTVDLIFTADEAGSESTAEIGDVPAHPDEPLQAPGAGIFLRTNTTAIVGQDEERDPALRARCRASTALASPAGPKDAYRYVALSTRVPAADDPEPLRFLYEQGDTAVNVNRAHVVSLGTGQIGVYLASPDGAAAGDTSTPGSDVYLVNRAIQLLVVPEGFEATVEAAAEVSQAIALTIDVLDTANVTAADAAAAALSEVNDFFRHVFPIGGRKKYGDPAHYIVMEEVRSIAKNALPGIYNVSSTPNSDVVIGSAQVVVATVSATGRVVTQ